MRLLFAVKECGVWSRSEPTGYAKALWRYRKHMSAPMSPGDFSKTKDIGINSEYLPSHLVRVLWQFMALNHFTLPSIPGYWKMAPKYVRGFQIINIINNRH